MNEQITIFYKKDKKHSNDYIVKRVFTKDGKYYSLSAYYMINNKMKEYKSNLKWTKEYINKYLLQCMKSDFFDRIEIQLIMGGNLNDKN